MKITPLKFFIAWIGGMAMSLNMFSAENALHLNLRSREGEKKAEWQARETALIICDMWDDHWCNSAARRVAEMAGSLNEAVKQARAKGVFIIHAPSSVTDFYKGTPQR